MTVVMIMKTITTVIRRNENRTHVCGYLVFIKNYKQYHTIYAHVAFPSGEQYQCVLYCMSINIGTTKLI